MHLSPDGIDQLIAREGSRSVMYRDSAGLPTIGVGHLLTKDELSSGKLYLGALALEWAAGLTEEHVRALLARDVQTSEIRVTAVVTVPLTQPQFDALVSFCFNVGAGAFRNSTLVRLLNAGDYAAVPEQLRRWKYSAGQVDPILVRRRESEIAQWLTAP